MTPKLKYIRLYVIAFLFSFLILYFFFYDSLTSFFSQDDFFHIRTIIEKNVGDIPYFFFSEQEEYAFYRPLSRETYNLLMFNLFELNSRIFHLVNFLLIILNGLLTFKLVRLFTLDIKAAIFTAILYFFSAVHSIELYYLASVQTLLATTMVLAGVIAYKQFLISKKKSFWYLTIVFFGLGIFSHESSVVILPLIAILEMIAGLRNRIKTIILNMLPFLVFFSFRIIIHFTGAELDKQTVYQPSLSIGSILNTFSWYSLWAFGLPEMLVDFATLTLQFNPNLFKYYGYYVSIVFPFFALILGSLLLITISLAKYKWSDKKLWFFGLGYLFSLSPFLLFPSHKFVYYLTLPLVFFCSFLSILLSNYWDKGKSHKFLVILVMVAYTAISIQTVNLNKITHWAAKRAKAADYLLQEVKKEFRTVPPGSTFYLKNDPDYPFIAEEWGTSSKQAFYILSGSDAFQVLFKDPSIEVYFEDVTGPPKERMKNLYIYEARFPY